MPQIVRAAALEALPAGAVASGILDALRGKQPLIKRSFRPPNYETPVSHYRHAFTPNDAFYERSTNGGSFVPVTTIDVIDQDRIRPQRTFRYRDPAPPGVYQYRVHAVTADGEPGITTAPLRIEVPAAEAAP